MQTYNNRNEVPDKYKWDLTSFFKNDKEFDESVKEAENLTKELLKYKNSLNDAFKLYEFLEINTKLNGILEDLYVYSYLLNDQELGVPSSIDKKNKIIKLCGSSSSLLSFFEPTLLSFDKSTYDNLFISNPTLNKYKFMLDAIYREKEHILTENEERIITELTTSMNHFDDMSSNLLNTEHNYGTITLSDGTKEVLSTTNFRKISKDKSEKVRKKARSNFYKVLDQYSSTSASFLDSYVSMNETIAKIRKYKSSWDASLFNRNMDDEVYKTLVKVTEDNVSSFQRYFDLKRKTLGFDVLHQYDLGLELTDNDKKYTIEEAQELCLNAIKPLGEDYYNHFKKIIDNHYIDYCQYKGKCSGGYSFATQRQDSRILLSFNDDLSSVSTIIHEGGHNVHHQYVKENNEPMYRDASSLVAEVASLTNECLLSSYLADNGKTKDEKLSGVANILGVIVSNLFGAVREGKMEEDMYNYSLKGNSLTNEYLNKLTLKSLKKYYGSSVKLDKYSKLSWINRSHYFMNFYLYSYSICISVASYVANEILKGNKEMLNNYVSFLKQGSNVWPIDAYKVLGVDLKDEKVYQGAIEYFNSLLDKFEKISKD